MTCSAPTAFPDLTGRPETCRLASVPTGVTVPPCAPVCPPCAWRIGAPGRRAYLEAEGRIGSPDGPAAVRAAALFVEVGVEHFAGHGDVQTIADEHHEYEVNL